MQPNAAIMPITPTVLPQAPPKIEVAAAANGAFDCCASAPSGRIPMTAIVATT